MTDSTRPVPDFDLLPRFVQQLREEADWVETIHRGDDQRGGTGQAATDTARLRRLADQVEILNQDSQRVGRNLGYVER